MSTDLSEEQVAQLLDTLDEWVGYDESDFSTSRAIITICYALSMY